jgi:hypothetical protein
MDATICVGLATVGGLLLQTTAGTVQDKRGQILFALFLSQYLLLKFYRVFLYHRYFSPLRHLPGPKVSPCLDQKHRSTRSNYR